MRSALHFFLIIVMFAIISACAAEESEYSSPFDKPPNENSEPDVRSLSYADFETYNGFYTLEEYRLDSFEGEYICDEGDMCFGEMSIDTDNDQSSVKYQVGALLRLKRYESIDPDSFLMDAQNCTNNYHEIIDEHFMTLSYENCITGANVPYDFTLVFQKISNTPRLINAENY
ncbi:hypothetical protein [Limisalsivibrio acetivorans]|uniref:hypothetical protein n=1 Tax=Limisalsivibrio acetivorans TaxID=1304888 RepID=UPI0003B7532B|nr:hypothetical protein [Limisalsivibrio acetivorans]